MAPCPTRRGGALLGPFLITFGDALSEPFRKPVPGEGVPEQAFALPEMVTCNFESIQNSAKNQHKEKQKVNREKNGKFLRVVLNVNDLSPQYQHHDHREEQIKAHRPRFGGTAHGPPHGPSKRFHRSEVITPIAPILPCMYPYLRTYGSNSLERET